MRRLRLQRRGQPLEEQRPVGQPGQLVDGARAAQQLGGAALALSALGRGALEQREQCLIDGHVRDGIETGGGDAVAPARARIISPASLLPAAMTG